MTMRIRNTLSERIEENEAKPCINCLRHREKFSRFCGRCKMRYVRTGNPSGMVRSRDGYKDELLTARRVIEYALKTEHKGTLEALKTIEDILSGKSSAPSRDILLHLQSSGINAVDILSECLALSLVYYLKPLSFISTWPKMNFQLGYSICKLKRMPRKVRVHEKEKIGGFLATRFKPLLMGYLESLHKAVKEKKKAAEIFSEGVDWSKLD
jgi:hypothetical protein